MEELNEIYERAREVAEKRIRTAICNLEKYNPKNIFSENEIRKEYGGKIIPWIKKHIGKRNKICIDVDFFQHCLKKQDNFKELEPFFKEIVPLKINKDIGIIIAPLKDIKFIGVMNYKGKDESSQLNINYSNFLAVIKKEDDCGK